MRAAVITENGGPDVISIEDVPRPAIGPDEVLVEVAACGLNYTDVWVRLGEAGQSPPAIPGSDIVGTVAELGEAAVPADAVDVGDPVVIYTPLTCGTCEFCEGGDRTLCIEYNGIGEGTDGGHAEYVGVPAENVYRLPDHVDPTRMAAAPSSFGTAWRALTTRGAVSPGDDVLVLGASGGVGTAAVQIATLAGATVLGCTSSEWKAERLRTLGADHVIDYTTVAFDDAVRELTDGRGVDLVLDSVGGEIFQRGVRSLRPDGRLVTVGATVGDADAAMLDAIAASSHRIVGSTGFTPNEFRTVMSQLYAGRLDPVLDSVLELADLPAGHRRLESRDVFGKLVVEL